MRTLISVSLATIYGLMLRALFGFMNNLLEVMSISFIILAPFIIGALTIYLIPKEKTTTMTGAFFKPWLTTLAILFFTLVLHMEGAICWFMIYPLFSILAGIGGIIIFRIRKQNKNDWEDNNTLDVSFVLLIPVLIGFLEGDSTLRPVYYTVEENLEIEASTEKVWHAITNINKISNDETEFSFSSFIGFPSHIETQLDTLAIGGKRKAIFERGLYFDETICQFEVEKLLVLDIKTDPYNIPPTVMDEHILIGGKHIDILQDIYKLEKISPSKTRLTLSSKFFINTPFNWYAGMWAKFLMKDILKGQLNLINKRSFNKNQK